MEPHLTQPHGGPQQGEPERGTTRFTFTNGDRPLAGYTIKRGIGRGGFGEVYFAVSDGGKEVAIKLIRHNLDVELRGVAHCLNLKHPHLIALYDVKEDDKGNHWVIMEYAVGESLEDVLNRHPEGLPPEAALDWLKGIAAGVGYLHDHGIVHRDLKPGNVFRDDGLVKLGDYGLSKFISCSRRSGQTESIGTVHYMAPEVANGRYGKEIDIYALGIILYEMLSGHVPFEGESVGEVLMKHLTAEPSLDAVPDGYRTIVARALAKDPNERFNTVDELMRAVSEGPAYVYTAPPQPEAKPHPQAAPHQNAGGTSPQAPPFAGYAKAAASDEEPVLKAVKELWANLRKFWDGLTTPARVGVVIFALIALQQKAVWQLLSTGAPTLFFLYIVYRIVGSAVKHHEATVDAKGAPNKDAWAKAAKAGTEKLTSAWQKAKPDVQAAGKKAGADLRAARQKYWQPDQTRWRRRASATPALVVKPVRERSADLVGSLILAALVGTVMSAVATMFLSSNESTGLRLEQLAWMTIVSVGSAWAVLIPAKFWEGTSGDPWRRRFVMLVSGLGIGALAYATTSLYLIKLPDQFSVTDHLEIDAVKGFYAADGTPLIQAYLMYFGSLFALPRWWKQADPLRTTRLSLWTLAVCVVTALLVNWFVPFPQPWGLLAAGITSFSVQLSSPYLNFRRTAAAT